MSAPVADELRGPDLGRPVTHVLVCPNGHIGVRHAGNHLDICHECGEACEFKPTSVSGKTRRSHSLRKFEGRDEADREGPVVLLEPLPESFELSDIQLAELAAGSHPIISMPKTETLSALQPGRLFEAGDVDIFVTAVREEAGRLIIDYLVHRAEQTIREDAPIIDRGATRQGRWVNLQTGEERPGSPEAERLSNAETNELARSVHERELAAHKEAHANAEKLLKELERDYTRDETWHAKKQVARLAARVSAAEERIRELSPTKRKD